ncbi:MAG: hypothetical protein KGL18_13955 [Burkholderiales bacterium]|nr:hypothetical protein [Burkholderiales bacterium]MDE2158986.1 hypothetical protein [Burkholderiales bacterium]MDE2504062.1 hypothetical protein [Burkholderiales bacterium]
MLPSPRDYTTGVGMPADRGARVAARKAFVDLKVSFLCALQDLRCDDWLVDQVRGAEQPVDLWLLRAPVFEALDGCRPEVRRRRLEIRRGLDSMFPDLDVPSGFSPL